jgi:hypothetical protein
LGAVNVAGQKNHSVKVLGSEHTLKRSGAMVRRVQVEQGDGWRRRIKVYLIGK